MLQTDRGGVQLLRAIFYRFAAMFPDKVERIILDGVEDSHFYYSGQ